MDKYWAAAVCRLSASDLLHVWEHSLALPPFQRALRLLEAAYCDVPPETFAKLSMGQRDTQLLRLREYLFGPIINGVVACPNCNTSLELRFHAADIQAASPERVPNTVEIETERYQVRFRLPNSDDLASVSGDIERRRLHLLERCILEATCEGVEQVPQTLPSEVVEQVIEVMAQVDLQADIQLQLSCEACQSSWHAQFDIVAFLWNEIQAWANHILHEVHILASHYCWSERDILAMSARRRQWYIQMVRQAL